MTREIPILFNSEMVRAIRAGRKTQTRRPMREQLPKDRGRIEVGPIYPTEIDRYSDEYPGKEIYGAYSDDGEWWLKSPFGKPGDILWVRETFCWAKQTGYDAREDEGPVWYLSLIYI